MWTVVYISPNKSAADAIKKILDDEGLLVMLRNIGFPNVGDTNAVEILVPESEVDEAMEILNTKVR